MSECLTHHHACACREAMFARAAEIADEAMTQPLECYGRSADEHGVVWALLDSDYGAVATLDEAEPPVIEAVRWLLWRERCELVESPDGATVVLLEKATK